MKIAGWCLIILGGIPFSLYFALVIVNLVEKIGGSSISIFAGYPYSIGLTVIFLTMAITGSILKVKSEIKQEKQEAEIEDIKNEKKKL